jgi:hypothetical protein
VYLGAKSMNISRLEKDIKSLRSKLYDLGKETNNFSQGEILKVSHELDKKIVVYQQLMIIELDDSYINYKE